MNRVVRVLLTAAGAASLAATVMAGPAHAGPATPSAQVGGRPTTAQTTAAAGCDTPLYFSRIGQMNCDSNELLCNWDLDSDWDEYFVIAPDRSIWHDWPTSGGWRQMPNSGKADDMHRCYVNGNGQRQVEVKVYVDDPDGYDVWYSYYSGGWRGWYYYPGT